MKTCSKCGIEKEVSEFPKRENSCKSCVAVRMREYRKANKEAIAARTKRYREDNKEAIAKKQRQYLKDNKEEIYRKHWEYRQGKKEEIYRKHREYKKANKEAIAEKQRQYHVENKEAISSQITTKKYGVVYSDYPHSKCPIIRHLIADCIDHCGGTGENEFTRGKISRRANSLMGCFNDNPELIRRAKEYIRGLKRVSNHIADASVLGHRVSTALKSRYGITPKQQWTMLCKQGWGCAICGKRLARTRKSAKELGGRLLATDHNHITGEVRGILCSKCNAALGHAEKPVDYNLRETLWVLERAAQYLEAYDRAPKAPYKSAYFHEDIFWALTVM